MGPAREDANRWKGGTGADGHLGIPGLHPHALRHACATHLNKEGAELAHVQKILGHSQITTTAEYVKLVIADLKKLIETKHPSERRYRFRKTSDLLES